jgi:hypothetical protein
MKRIVTTLILSATAFGLQAQTLGVHKIYAASFGTADGATSIRETIVVRLVQSGKVTIVVDNPEEVDDKLTSLGGKQEARQAGHGAGNLERGGSRLR